MFKSTLLKLEDVQSDLQQVIQLPELHKSDDDEFSTFVFDMEDLASTHMPRLTAQQLSSCEQLNTYRLGIYFEWLWRTLIDNSTQYNCLLQNQQVIDHKQTLGEFDFILQHQHQILHLEVAIKFYLNISHLIKSENDDFFQLSEREELWRGPNCSDSLATKYNHLSKKQLKLSRLPAAQALLNANNIDAPQAVFSLKGFLFNHWQHQGVKPKQYNEQHIDHHWLYIDELSHYLEEMKRNFQQPHTQLFLIDKFSWIRQSHQQLHTINIDEASAMLDKKDSPIMLAICTLENSSCALKKPKIIESQRFFVAPRCWPSSKTLDEVSRL